ncbi:TGBp1 family protein [Streptomyces sp. MST-110588]|uniref:TGBp1 family protein n=1 Tax=Streptomyces sp. MST-110588 TaxID=2833628 RepID=UPI001F5D7644|nr:TGBp1 family protein [Streptomyces sp. MST-110588]
MSNSISAGVTETGKPVIADRGPVFRPRGVVDLRGVEKGGVPAVLTYPVDAVVVVSGLPGSGKSTLLRRTSEAAPVIDPRVAHVACEAVMPGWLPYAVYRPWARWRYFRWLRTEVRSGGPLLVHDCGGRPWMRRWLSGHTGRQGRELHLIVLDVGVAEALSGQDARGRWAPRRAFARHRKGLDRLLRALSGPDAAPPPAPRAGGTAVITSPPATRLTERPAAPTAPLPDLVREAASVVLLDRRSREQVAAVEFVTAPAAGRAPWPSAATAPVIRP